MTKIDNVSLISFEGTHEASLYTKYLQLQYQVFVRELNFHIDSDSSKCIVLPDSYDEKGKFVMALNEKGHPVGILRAVLSKDGFPKKKLIKHHLLNKNVSPLIHQTATLNALAVKEEYRSKYYRKLIKGKSTSLANALSLLVFANLDKCGVRLVFLNATIGATVYVYYKLGFKVIDLPYIYQSNLPPIVNMAILLPNLASEVYQSKSEKRPLSLQEIACATYLESTQKKVLNGKSIWKFFQATKKNSLY